MVARGHRKRYLPIVILGLCVSLLGAGSVALMRSFLNGAHGQPKRLAQEFHVIRPPPPPPDLPPPPPPPDEKVVPEEQRPDPTPSNEPPPSEQLGLDTEGGSGSDSFGLLGHKGGRDLLASGGSAYAWYAGLLKTELLDQLQESQAARKGSYSVVVRVWVRADGTIERVHLTDSTGDNQRDKAIEAALSRIPRLSQAPPADMPQPISLRIVSRA